MLGYLARAQWPTNNLSSSQGSISFINSRSDLMTGPGLETEILRSPWFQSIS